MWKANGLNARRRTGTNEHWAAAMPCRCCERLLLNMDSIGILFSVFHRLNTCCAFFSPSFIFSLLSLPPTPTRTSRPRWCIRNSNGREGNNGNGRPITGAAHEEHYPRCHGGCARYLWFDVSDIESVTRVSFGPVPCIFVGGVCAHIHNVLHYTPSHLLPCNPHPRLNQRNPQCNSNSEW